MTKLFVDTSGWANLIDISQPYHDLAVQIYHDRRSQKGSPEQRVIIKAYHEKQAKKRFRILSKFINP
jgi:hypothetical protein